MHTNKIIIPTGYMGSGSSAITDLLNGLEGFDVSRSTFEFVFLHCPNGVFDLEDKLLIGNNAVRSDEALHSFARTMKQLYDKKYWWVGHYNDHVSQDFYQQTQRYIDRLTIHKPDYYWYWQENVEPKMVPQLIKNKLLKFLPGGKSHIRKPLAYSPMWVAFPEPEEFYAASRAYLGEVFGRMGLDKAHLVLDQLLLPHNLFRFSHYFGENAEVFVVDRDPRDVFISNKYFWSRNHEPVPYPTDVDAFCDFYRRLRQMEKPAQDPHIHRVHFEDLIYKHRETVDEIYRILGVDAEKARAVCTRFQPEKSIYNTQLFLKSPDYAAECRVVAEKLSQYLYDFPYPVDHAGKSVF